MAGLVLVRQRPGKGNAIFLTLEDEAAVANIIVWQRDFARLLPFIMGTKLVRVSGRLQSESGVVHIVAETMEDLTPWLDVLLPRGGGGAGPSGKALPRSIGQKARHGDESCSERPFARAAGQHRISPLEQEPAAPSTDASQVMPKGRNFQ